MATAGSPALSPSPALACRAAIHSVLSRCRSVASTLASARRRVASLGVLIMPVSGSGLAPNARSTHSGASAAHWAWAATSSCPAHAVAAVTTPSRNPSS